MIYQTLKTQLKTAGVELPELEARILLREFAGVTDTDILIGNIPDFDQTKLNEALSRRIKGEPMGRILGYREFWGRKFYLSPATLEPRPDTETLIEAVLKEDKKPKTILDLGTGTGCILLTLLHEIPNSIGVGVDLSPEACETAKQNAKAQGVDKRVSFIQSDWLENVEGKFDLIVSNPPYITSEDVENLESNVRDFDPRLALDGGKDGLEPYRNLLGTLKNVLAEGGV
ncbi:MAG: peptide chain release factor N(5)-glutamine methyltransferase, partial [Micavibrio aeruginosavorus]